MPYTTATATQATASTSSTVPTMSRIRARLIAYRLEKRPG